MTKLLSDLRNDWNFFSHVKIEHLIAGLSGGMTSTLILHPLDVIKIRLAVNEGRVNATPRYTSIGNAFTTIFNQEGVRGFYRGITPNLCGAGASWGLYFFFYNSIKTLMNGGNPQIALGPEQHLLAASQSGVMTLFLTNPIWVVKTRLCLQFSDKTQNTYKGMADALLRIYRTEGLPGYYRGLVAGLFGVSHGAVQFMVYEELKNKYHEYKGSPINSKLGTTQYLTFAAVSKLIAVGTTYPYQVIRARLQNQHIRYEGALHCIRETWHYEGWKGFYKGLGPNLIRVVPATMITFWTYENVSYFLIKKENE